MRSSVEVSYLVRKLVAQDGAAEILALHRWSDESERWHELVHVVANAVISWPDLQVRALVDRLAMIGLLEPKAWAATPDPIEGRRLIAELVDIGVDQAEAEHAAQVIGEAARSLAVSFDGKAQRLLRKAGEQALASLIADLDTPSLEAEMQREALTTWLQNTTSMPLPLVDASTRRFCREYGVAPQDLVQAADDLDLNVACLDDLIHAWSQATPLPEDEPSP